ncbi:hypothetical protein L226DRAFT_566489 [Lentinus tigrinus ALCF2SS1-7]|uniref:Large ribosomal subunit protein mL49 n=1 Tax=Lentinus tigrinus ALCF2SS1-6 TaxID=1328759 RepID=A0A5C2SSA2_9APHY|nr:hypothetical protein L227DRAFT_128893 [Lentinus tigrinus ALCF2SS1-6]RPD79945.1 hypothetical protein L226DRAFT_566489 [Lentinus tigrinus ALCF2SS1-7]
MLFSLVRPALASPFRQARLYSQLAQHAPSPTSQSTLPYLVRRNARGSIPVYTDIRNGGTRYLVLIRNVEGNADALADDLARTLFPAGSSEAERIQVQTVHQKHVVISGGRWKSDVIRWLAQRGF